MKATQSPLTPSGRDRALRLRRRLRTSVAAGSLAAVVALGFAAEQTHRGTSYATTTTTTTSANNTTSTTNATTTPSATSTPSAVSSAGSGSAVVVSGGS